VAGLVTSEMRKADLGGRANHMASTKKDLQDFDG
jgi:hypothetical protein